MFKFLVILYIVELYNQINIYKQFHDSARFMACSLSNLFYNFSEAIHKIKCKYRDDIKNVKHMELSTKIVNAALNIQIIKII